MELRDEVRALGLMLSTETGGVLYDGDMAGVVEEEQKGEEDEEIEERMSEAADWSGRRRCLALSAANLRSIVEAKYDGELDFIEESFLMSLRQANRLTAQGTRPSPFQPLKTPLFFPAHGFDSSLSP